MLPGAAIEGDLVLEVVRDLVGGLLDGRQSGVRCQTEDHADGCGDCFDDPS